MGQIIQWRTAPVYGTEYVEYTAVTQSPNGGGRHYLVTPKKPSGDTPEDHIWRAAQFATDDYEYGAEIGWFATAEEAKAAAQEWENR